MSYTYNLELYLANIKPTIDLCGKADILKKAEAKYNERSIHMQNCKEITIHAIESSHIILTLKSSLSLNSVGRALRTFSTILINEYKDPDFISQITSSGALFKAVQEDHDSAQSTSELSQLTDLEFVKKLMDYVYSKRDPDSSSYRKKRLAMEEIKKISIESGLIH